MAAVIACDEIVQPACISSSVSSLESFHAVYLLLPTSLHRKQSPEPGLLGIHARHGFHTSGLIVH